MSETTAKKTTTTGRNKPRGSYAKSSSKRAAIMEAALAVFAKDGYRGGSLRDVAMNVGMSEAGLLHHFPSKTALLAGVLDLRDQRSLEMVPLDSDRAHDTLRGLVALARYNASVPGVVELYCTLSAEATSADHPAHAYFVERYASTIEKITHAFALCAKLGTLRGGVRPDGAARATVALMDGLQVQWLLDRDSVDMAEDLESFLREIVDLDAA